MSETSSAGGGDFGLADPPPDRNCLSYWFPLVEAAGLPVPKTAIVKTKVDLIQLLDGVTPDGFWDFLDDLTVASVQVGGAPFFLRTGHGSGKHDWEETCYVRAVGELGRHVSALVEWSVNADVMGLPTEVWAARALIPTQPLFRCTSYGDFPVTREFRVFVRDGAVEHVQPYWPRDAVEQGHPDNDDWASLLAEASHLTVGEEGVMCSYAVQAGLAVGGYWSVDFLQGRGGNWWLTDMADGYRSFRYDP